MERGEKSKVERTPEQLAYLIERRQKLAERAQRYRESHPNAPDPVQALVEIFRKARDGDTS